MLSVDEFFHLHEWPKKMSLAVENSGDLKFVNLFCLVLNMLPMVFHAVHSLCLCALGDSLLAT